MTPSEREELAKWCESWSVYYERDIAPVSAERFKRIAAALREPVATNALTCPKCGVEWVHWSEAIQCFALCAGLTISQAVTAGPVAHSAPLCSPGQPQPATVTTSPLDALLTEARERVEKMSPQEREAMIAAQRESWMRGEMALSKEERKTTVLSHPTTDAKIWVDGKLIDARKAHARIGELEAENAALRADAARWQNEYERMMSERNAEVADNDALRAEVERRGLIESELRTDLRNQWVRADDLCAEVERMRPVVDAALVPVHDGYYARLDAAVHDYRRAKEKP